MTETLKSFKPINCCKSSWSLIIRPRGQKYQEMGSHFVLHFIQNYDVNNIESFKDFICDNFSWEEMMKQGAEVILTMDGSTIYRLTDFSCCERTNCKVSRGFYKIECSNCKNNN